MPLWTIRCTYGEGALDKRAAALATHEAYLVAHSREICFAGPMFADNGATRTGLWLMIEAPDRAHAEAFIAEEGFNRAGMFGAIEIKRFVPAGPGLRRQIEIVPDPACQMFVCEFAGGSGTALQFLIDQAVARGLNTTDDGARPLGAVAIVEVADRAAVDALLGPLAGAEANTNIRIDRWRFGKSVV